jgi:glyoxylase-like metal-dependent hydrolase (beta-lactamase superfamily II)
MTPTPRGDAAVLAGEPHFVRYKVLKVTYTGEVRVGGPSDAREIDGLIVTKIAVGPMDNNAYLLRCASTGQGLLIDAANEPGRLIEMIGDTPVGTIVTTHQHYDHWQALPELAKHTGAVVVAHPADADELPVPVGRRAEHGEVLTFGDATVSLIHLRGHTPGSLAVLYDAGGRLASSPHVFTGDSLFPGGVGRTTTPEDFTSLLTDVTERVFDPLPDATWVYPGHGKDTTLGAERPALPEWRARGW